VYVPFTDIGGAVLRMLALTDNTLHISGRQIRAVMVAVSDAR
jgi:hypothetical protein